MSNLRRGPVALALAGMLVLASCSSSGSDTKASPDKTNQPAKSTTTEKPAGASTTAGSGTGQKLPDAKLVEGKCPVKPEGLVGVVKCGTVAVPLDYSDPTAKTIDIAVAVYPTQPDPDAGPGAKPAKAAPDPVFFLGGGPGQKTLASPGAISSIAPVLLQREVVVIDQRGVGESRPALDCPALDKMTEDDASVKATEACQKLLSQETDLSAYGTVANAADLDQVRKALDAERINVVGTSYGTRLALEYARGHSDSLRSMILNSPAPADENFQADAPVNGGKALKAVIDACNQDSACQAANPDLNASVDKILENAKDKATTVQVKDVKTGKETPVKADEKAVVNALFQTLYIGPLLGGLPQAITAASKGDLTPLIQAGSLLNPAGTTSRGMYLSTSCAEQLSRVDVDAVESDARDISKFAEALASTQLPVQLDQCKAWDVKAAGDELFEPVSSKVPTLIVTGEFDPVTPVAYGKKLTKDLSNATLVEVAATGHDPLSTGPDMKCGPKIAYAFISDPGTEVDTACAEKGKLKFTSMADAFKALQAKSEAGGS